MLQYMIGNRSSQSLAYSFSFFGFLANEATELLFTHAVAVGNVCFAHAERGEQRNGEIGGFQIPESNHGACRTHAHVTHAFTRVARCVYQLASAQ